MSLLCRSSNGSLAGGVFPQCKLCRRPARSHRCCSWTRLRRPLLYSDRCSGSDSTENCGISAVAVLTRWSMSLFMQFIDGMDVAVTMQRRRVSRWKCLRLSSSPELVDIPVCFETVGFRRGFGGGDVGLGIFALLRVVPEERQFSETSMTKSSFLSRAPAN